MQVSQLPTVAVAAAAQAVTDAGITDPLLADAAMLDLLLTGDPGFIAGAAAGQDPDAGLGVFVPPTPPLIGLVSPLAAVAEGDVGGTTMLSFTVFRTGNAAEEVSLARAVQANGRGFTNADDHGGSLPAGSVTMAVGETEKTFSATTGTPAGYTVAAATGQGLVTNGDGPVLPVATDDTASTGAGQPVLMNPFPNDIDPIAAGLSVAAVGNPGHGQVALQGNLVTYTPDPGFSGGDSSTCTVSLAGGGTDTGTVAVMVAAPAAVPDAPPVAGTDTVGATAGAERVILPGILLANDSDPEGSPPAVAGVVRAPQHGTAQYDGSSGIIR